ncbi:MAG: hypothetical protein N3G20_01700 [Verrucomicrobiae bacterium]|nr:hypothetical protein [Verrucomicrobiae bacterium]
MNRRTSNYILIGLICCAVVVCIYLSVRGGSKNIQLGVYQALGAVTAEETAKLIPKNAKVLVIVRDAGPGENPAIEAQLDAFRKTLKKHRGPTMTVATFDASPALMMYTGGAISETKILELLEQYKDVNALVLFCPLPPLSDPGVALLKNRKLTIVVVASFRPDYAALIKDGVIRMVVAPREIQFPSETPEDQPRSLRALFDRQFVIIDESSLGNRR